jgi:hypothetical protein
MNMKKTIAAAAAGAMAVSATATAASAAVTQPAIDTQGSFVYSLVKNFAVPTNGKATVVASNTFDAEAAGTATSIYINLGGTNPDSAITQDSTGTLYIATNAASDSKILYDADIEEDGDTRITVLPSQVIVIPVSGLMAHDGFAYTVKYTAEITLDEATRFGGTGDLRPDYEDAAAVRGVVRDADLFAIGHSVVDTINTSASFLDATNIADYATTNYQVTDYTAYDPAGLIVHAPLRSDTNTTKYGGGVPNIIAYLEGYDDDVTVQNYYVLEGADNDLIPGYRYLGQAEEFVTTIADAGDYINVMSVLNDTIANYDVVFKFGTAKENVWDTDTDSVDDGEIFGVYNADGRDIYTSFNQHLYGLYGNDESYTPFYATNGNYFLNPGINYNLFQGGLVVNDTYSMQLADTSVFNYSATAISFAMDDIESNAIAQYNSWLDYVQSLRLATSAQWFWDDLTITWATPVDDTVATGEGVGSDEVTLDDEPAAEDEVAVPEAEVEVPVAPNPATGNSAVALAVIPVALAAAAIVAKKRK